LGISPHHYQKKKVANYILVRTLSSEYQYFILKMNAGTPMVEKIMKKEFAP
jgi:hypothetical protein